MSVTDLEKAVSDLRETELSQFAQWFEDYMADKWDRQIERDFAAGKLNALIKKVDEEIDSGHSTPL